MDIEGLSEMIKIEVVVDSSDVAFVEQLLHAEGVTGWTAVNGLAGFGHTGRHEGRLLFNETGGQSMLISVLPEARLEGILAGLRALFERRPGVMFVSSVYVSRADHFGTTG